MPTGTQVKPTHKPVKEYYTALQRYAGQKVAHEDGHLAKLGLALGVMEAQTWMLRE